MSDEKNEKAQSKDASKKWQLQNADTDTQQFASDLWQRAAQHHPMEPLPNGRSAAAPCGVQFVNVVCCMPRLATRFHFAFDTRESINLLIKFACLMKSGAWHSVLSY